MIVHLEEEFTVNLFSDRDEASWGDMLQVGADYLRSSPDLEVTQITPTGGPNGKILRLNLKRLTDKDTNEAH